MHGALRGAVAGGRREIGGEIEMAAAPVPYADTSAVTTNCLRYGNVALVTLLTACSPLVPSVPMALGLTTLQARIS